MTVWFTMRGAGLAALILLTITTCLGVAGARRSVTVSSRYVAQYVHRTTALLGLGALALHVATALADSYAHVGAVGAIVPFTSGYRASWVGLGTIAGYLLVITIGTGLARARFAQTPRAAGTWRGLHLLSYGAWALALLHGFESGTDSGLGWVRAVYLACLVAVPAALLLRTPAEVPAVTR